MKLKWLDSLLNGKSPQMNDAQAKSLWGARIGIVIFVVLGLFPPWVQRHYGLYGVNAVLNCGYRFVVAPPDAQAGFVVAVDWSRLILQWLIIAAVAILIAVWHRSRGREGRPDTAAVETQPFHFSRTGQQLVEARKKTLAAALTQMTGEIRPRDMAEAENLSRFVSGPDGGLRLGPKLAEAVLDFAESRAMLFISAQRMTPGHVMHSEDPPVVLAYKLLRDEGFNPEMLRRMADSVAHADTIG